MFNAMDTGTASVLDVADYTTGELGLAMRKSIDPDADNYISMKQVDEYLDTDTRLTDATKTAIRQFYYKENMEIGGNLNKRSTEYLDTAMERAFGDKGNFTFLQLANNDSGLMSAFSNQRAKAMQMGKNVSMGDLSLPSEARQVYDGVLDEMKAMQANQLGPFSADNLDAPPSARLAILTEAIDGLMKKKFNALFVAQAKDRKTQKEAAGLRAYQEKVDAKHKNQQMGRMIPGSTPQAPIDEKQLKIDTTKKKFQDNFAEGNYGTAIALSLQEKVGNELDEFGQANQERAALVKSGKLKHTQDMAQMFTGEPKIIKEGTIVHQAVEWFKSWNQDFAKQQGWSVGDPNTPVVQEGVATMRAIAAVSAGKLMIGMENHEAEKAVPPPRPTPSVEPPEVSQAMPPVDTGQSMVQQVATALAPVADAVFGGSTVSAEPTKFEDLPIELQQEAEAVQYTTPEDATSSIMRNNPMNVEISKNNWQGLVESDSSRFMATDTPLNGLRAGYINFLAKLSRGQTVAEMIETLSPKSDNNPTASMVKVVSAMADLSPDDTLEVSMDNFEAIKQLGLGILRFEAPGHKYPDSLIDEATKLAIEQKSSKSQQPVPDKSKMYPPPKNFKREKELKPIVEKTGNLFDSIGEAMRTGLTEAIPDNLRFFASYLHDEYRGLQGRGTEKPVITENQLSSGVQSILKTAALKAHAEGRDYVTYTDYPDSGVGLSVPAIVASKGAKNKEEYLEAKKRYPKGWKGKARLLLDSTDDVIAAATTIGQFSFKIENGELVLLDTYNFSKYGGAKNSAYAEVRKSVESNKTGVAYQIKANLGKFA